MLPFERDAASGAGQGEEQLLHDALTRWSGIAVVDPFQVRDALVHEGPLQGTALVNALAHTLDQVRREWIAADPRDWLERNIPYCSLDEVRRLVAEPERTVLVTHAVRNSLVPVFSLIVLQIGHILGGTVILESIFAIPGMGMLIFESVQLRDYPVVLGCVVVYGAVFVLVNLVVDVLYGVIDPRIRYA